MWFIFSQPFLSFEIYASCAFLHFPSCRTTKYLGTSSSPPSDYTRVTFLSFTTSWIAWEFLGGLSLESGSFGTRLAMSSTETSVHTDALGFLKTSNILVVSFATDQIGSSTSLTSFYAPTTLLLLRGLSSAPPIPAGIRSFWWNSGGFRSAYAARFLYHIP